MVSSIIPANYGPKTQERIIDNTALDAILPPPCTDHPKADDCNPAAHVILRMIALAQSVREAEDRAAVAYAATLRCNHPWCGQDHSAQPYGVHPHHSGFDLAVCETCNPPSLAPSGTD